MGKAASSRPGSSPHTRGTPWLHWVLCITVRFIPTHAGNTPSLAVFHPWLAVHPHTRGEHLAAIDQEQWDAGSSPHTRGTHQKHTRRGHMHRFIPTHAGNTPKAYAPGPYASVHPHTRGEHTPPAGNGIIDFGSSPHTRGTPRAHQPHGTGERFIPTHAGNTSGYTWQSATNTVHPHTRGEHDHVVGHHNRRVGSSPHTRGTHVHPGKSAMPLRFIPTHAGNTLNGPAFARKPPVHPHTRGEHPLLTNGHWKQYGSSPHTRGTHIYTD